MNRKVIILLGFSLFISVLIIAFVYMGVMRSNVKVAEPRCLIEGEELGGACADCAKKKCCDGLVPVQKEANGQLAAPGSGSGWFCSVK